MTTHCQLDIHGLISARAKAIDASGIRRVFELGAKLEDPINLSIGQPDFAVPDAIKDATIDAIRADRNGYTVTQGAADLLDAVWAHLEEDVGWSRSADNGAMITSGTSGGLVLCCMALLDPGDEAIIPDPYFVMYPHLATMTGGKAVRCDTYPDFRLTAERVEPLITERTKLLLVNSPSNPSGTVLGGDDLRELVELCDRRGVLLVSDEIYDTFTYDDARENGRCPSPARFTDRMLLLRGFGKSYGCTGWRMGYAAGPLPLMQEMAKLQQYTFVCAPSMAQAGVIASFDVDMRPHVDAYRRRRDMVVEAFRDVAPIATPGGAFYAFVPVPERFGTASAFVEEAIARKVLIIPGSVFSERDTHFRLSYATSEDKLEQGLEILTELMS